jgi:hypothetical protein
MIEDMTLAGLAQGTQKLYAQAVYRLAAHYRRSPDQLSEEEVRAYLLSLRQQGVARGTFQTSQYGLRFLYHHTLGRAWGEKGSPRRGRSGYLKRCRMIRFGACSARSATRFTRRALPSCMHLIRHDPRRRRTSPETVICHSRPSHQWAGKLVKGLDLNL